MNGKELYLSNSLQVQVSSWLQEIKHPLAWCDVIAYNQSFAINNQFLYPYLLCCSLNSYLWYGCGFTYKSFTMVIIIATIGVASNTPQKPPKVPIATCPIMV